MESFFLQLRVSTAVAVSVSRGGVRAADAEIKNPSGEIPELWKLLLVKSGLGHSIDLSACLSQTGQSWYNPYWLTGLKTPAN